MKDNFRVTLLVLVILVTAGMAMALLQSTLVFAYFDRVAVEHSAVLDGSAGEPFRWRVLTPMAVDLLAPDHSPAAVHTAYTLAHMLLLPLALVTLYAWSRRTHTPLAALVGVLLIALYLPLAFMNDYTLGLWSITELALFCAAMLAINRPRIFAGLVIVATLNRETAVLLPLAWIVWHWGDRRAWWGLFHFAVWVLVYLTLRVLIGGGVPADAVVARNIGANWSKVVLAWAMITPCVVLTFAGWRSSPIRVRRLLLVTLAYMPLYLTFGLWHELRLLLSIVPFVLPIALHSIASLERIHDDEYSTFAR